MSFFDPLLNQLPQFGSKRGHLLRFQIRNRAADFIAAYVPLFAKNIKSADQIAACADRQSQRLDDAVVVRIPSCTKTGSGQRRCGGLERGIVSNGETRIARQVRCTAGTDVAVRQGQQVPNFPPAPLVRAEPAVLHPVVQAHVHRRSKKSFRGGPRR